jgi:hypothetical protein
MRARSMHFRFLAIALLGLVASGSFAGAAVADSSSSGGRGRLSVSGAGAPGARGSNRAPSSPDHVIPAPDGGFENGPPPNSGWTEVTNTECEWIVDPTAAWGIPAHTGTYAFWAGGYCGTPNSDSVSQRVRIRPTHPTLQFYANYYRVDPDDPPNTDIFYVKIGNTTVFSKAMSTVNNTYPNWVLETVDLSAYAGMTVRLTIGGRSRGDLTGNVLVDDVGFNH